MDLKQINSTLQHKSPEEILAYVLEQFNGNVALASSFGAEDQVLTDMLCRIDPNIKIFTLDTGRLPAETYALMDKTREKYGVDIQIFFPDTEDIEKLYAKQGVNGFYSSVENRKECCYVRKVKPLKRALKGLSAWITGLRKEQSVTRDDVQIVEYDATHGLYKINPLAEWSETDVWSYIRFHNVPYNKLHDEGYPSIGCAPCTRAVQPGEDSRAGRWWWESPEKKECGLHLHDKGVKEHA
ncbi:phosphoadenylyl-sulfate reductase [Hydrogenimonas thermophila]|uniref:Adenosine 5'-phosphosulfate reductase n=1 Tax=Hydrogenimonas thermophila TaxID=223786 RepID=A0A1I5PK37_9BACT|nr:phosphoadenylyl-sulfate reductase [Hydrogenimonas thermophila]SFP34502.1 phosphoadenosine phosphosulfate reductase [Hydrogenimonas thermophila]